MLAVIVLRSWLEFYVQLWLFGMSQVKCSKLAIYENIAGAQPRHFHPEDGNFSVC
jgi:hypothetical protein